MNTITETELIEAIKNSKSVRVEKACYERIVEISKEYGRNGEIARHLMRLVKELIEL